MIWTALVLTALLLIAVHRVNALDGGEDYGSNIGWYWPWTPIIQASFAGLLFCMVSA